MPNICECILEITGPQSDIEDFLDRAWRNLESIGMFPFHDPAPPTSVLQSDDYDSEKWEVFGPEIGAHEWDTSTFRIVLAYATAWVPNIDWVACKSAESPTLRFSLQYREPNMQFRGSYVTEAGEVSEDICGYWKPVYIDEEDDPLAEADGAVP